jgi:zinc and cadmium transporter
MLELLFYSLIGGLFSLIGGVLLLWKENLTRSIITPLIALGAGAFLGAAFLDILPEALELSAKPNPVLVSTLVGFVVFFVLERLLMIIFKEGDNHEHSEHTETLPHLIILGDSIHNFLDGIVISLAYLANPTLGLASTLAIAAHEIPQEIGDFSVLLKLKFSKSKVLAINVMQSILTIPGVLAGYYFGQLIQPQLPILLGFAAGIFIYISASDLIPELHHYSGHKHFTNIIIPFLGSILAIYWLIKLSHAG